ncbi:MAG: hypothetical protein A2V81_04330 [Candidatus Abawacabacteria bacterium RBG_16_42_10]|uniref:Isoleucine--tRNA ligase n=1 Tax=Candidatus Abawacabacteria bacterium RBG_16_42_10 TaxID=1817814 RepID=A0A1F4XLC6_9BACT|nr:MAG: hypothetical protein A2V81_04330 [Candidatus Abawacabacteria bacterium RBG_16_42_10]
MPRTKSSSVKKKNESKERPVKAVASGDQPQLKTKAKLKKPKKSADIFQAVDTKQSFPDLENDILAFWRDEKIFEKTLESRKGGKNFVFYEGPPTANGKPGVHHVLARVFKDIILRYKTMQGFNIERKAGWDTHGLPVELQVEKELGISGKKQIEEYGIKEFNQKCKDSVHKFTSAFEEMTERIGYWVDMKNPYVTYSPEYIESVWWTLKQIWEKGLLYRDLKIVPYCCRCGTPLSSHEVAQEYQTVKDLSLTALFKAKPKSKVIKKDEDVYFAAWTTTPWTLIGNLALAVGPDVEYSKIKISDTLSFIIATERIAAYHDVLPKHPDGTPNIIVQETYKGSELTGIEYQPPWQYYSDEKPGWFIVAEPFVTTADGTGIVHIALYGEDDFHVIQKYDLPRIQHVNKEGKFIEGSGPYSGKYFKEEGLDVEILKDLAARNLLLKKEKYEHNYPHCWRCKTPLIYFAINSWFIRMSQLRDNLLKNNAEINWYPEHIKNGRFGKWLEEVKDWALSRNRYWGTPLPVWECQSCGKYVCVGSLVELQKKSQKELPKNDEGEIDLHRPFLDEVVITCESCGGESKRVEEVIDCWFDSGAMPVAQVHYPFDIAEGEFQERYFPADYICEAIDQTRGWFYTLLAISTVIFDKPAYKNVICLGHILDENGRKMSKSLGNVVDPMEVTAKQGADALRWYMFNASPPDQARNFSLGLVEQSLRKFQLTLWNAYAFFVTYANIDQFKPKRFTKIIAVRHTEGEQNVLGVNSTDKEHVYHLTDNGRRDAEALAQKFKNRPIDRMYISSLMRTQEVAQIINQFHNVPVTQDEHLREMDMGQFDGKLASDVQAYLKSLTNPYAEKFPEGESYLDLEKRVFELLDYIEQNHSGETVMIVTHEAVKRMIDKYFNHTPSEEALHKNFSLGHHDTYVMPWTEHKLDHWILSELHTLIQVVTDHLDSYEIWEATTKIERFVDNLSNWYIRRSRRRFWKTENDKDKDAAYQTLYHVLTTLTRIIAPFVPFVSESMYRNITKKDSVHMANFPHPIKSFIRANLNEEMGLIRTIVNLGHSLRAAQKIKTRQPLASATVVSPYKLNEEELQVIAEELNVKEIIMKTEAESTIHRAVKPKAAVLGPKYGKDMQKIIDAAKNDNFTFDDDGRVTIDGTFTLNPDEFDIVYQTEPGMSVTSQDNIVVALDTKLTDDLIQEGYAREIVRHIQELRKRANYRVDSRINVAIEVQSEEEMAHAILSKFSTYIARETLADSINAGNIIADIEEQVSIDTLQLFLKVEKVKKKTQ